MCSSDLISFHIGFSADVNAKKSAENPMWKEISESQKKYAERAVRWDLDTIVGRRMAYNWYFGKKPAAKKA